MNTYKTNEIAQIIGIHVNTVRLYEANGLISKPERLHNRYRVYTDLHIEQFRLARAALEVEVLQNGLRKQAVDIIKITALGDYDTAKEKTDCYLQQIELEKEHAEEAVSIARNILNGLSDASLTKSNSFSMMRKETADYLGITVDTLRNWELNGLITIKRSENRYRVYHFEDMQRLKIIRSLRCANYSLSAILRMLGALSVNPGANLRDVIDTPESGEDIITACDHLLTSLSDAKRNMLYAAAQIDKMRQYLFI